MSKPPFPRFATIVAVIAASIGMVMVLGSRLFLETLNAQTTPATLLLLRMLGGTIGGTSLIYCALRNSTDRRQWIWLLVMGVVEDGAMSLFFYGGVRDGVVNALGWGVEAALVSVVAMHLAVLIVMLRNGDEGNSATR